MPVTVKSCPIPYVETIWHDGCNVPVVKAVGLPAYFLVRHGPNMHC